MAAKLKQPKGREPGIYFGLPNRDYHADPALSHSGMVKLLVSELDYWINGPLNPEREAFEEPKRGSGKWYGSMRHEFLLERQEFWNRYRVIGMTGKGGNYTWLQTEEYRQIKAAINEIDAIQKAAGFFKLGYPEVSIFWRCRTTGIMLRIRVDYLRVFGGLDYKTARSLLNNQLGWQIADFGYDMQEALYEEGIREIKRLLREGKAVISGEVDEAWLKEFMMDEDCHFRFFFQRSEPPHIFRIIGFDKEIIKLARAKVEDAKYKYLRNINKYGAERWPAGKVQPEEFSIFHLPKRITE